MLDQQKITIIYCRLSVEDIKEDTKDGKGNSKADESNSIQNQKELLLRYAKDHGYTNTKVLIDDGYTGTNFNRPSFQQMIEDIELGYISTIIVKDMSRLGRNYLEVGYYTDNYFPQKNVRFIAINDGVDSADGDNEFAPIRNVINELYARDISRKVRSSYRIRGNSGEPLSKPPYGYTESPDNPKKWIIDPEAAAVVKRIFQMSLEGKGNETIARILHEEKVLVPTSYMIEKGIRQSGRKPPDPCKWMATTVGRILESQEYCGDVINFKTYSRSFKDKRRLANPKENWVIFKDVHEPIVDRETFELVQKSIKNTKRRAPKPENGEKSIFSDLLYCSDCGHKLWHHVNPRNKDIKFFSCSNYKKDTRGTCDVRHYVRADAIEQVVMLELKRLAKFLEYDEEAFADMLAEKTNEDLVAEKKQVQKELDRAIARNEDVARLYERLYEDNVSGKVTDEWFMQLSHKYESERLELKTKIQQYREQLSNLGTMQKGKEQFISAVRKFMQMETLTAPLLKELIDKIVVYETQGTGKYRTQRIVIYYRFVGYLEIPLTESEWEYYQAYTRQGVAVEYISKNIPA